MSALSPPRSHPARDGVAPTPLRLGPREAQAAGPGEAPPEARLAEAGAHA